MQPVERYAMDITRDILAAYLANNVHSVPTTQLLQLIEDVYRKVDQLARENG